jgi:hypothetical protein
MREVIMPPAFLISGEPGVIMENEFKKKKEKK